MAESEPMFKPLPDGRIKCAFCNCTFFYLKDYAGHLEKFGSDRYTHTVRLNDLSKAPYFKDYPDCIYQIEQIILDYKEKAKGRKVYCLTAKTNG